MRGFKPACATCRCQPGPAAKIGGTLGRLIDRRHEPFCDYKLGRDQKYQGNKSYTFVVSSGHTGSRYQSSENPKGKLKKKKKKGKEKIVMIEKSGGRSFCF